LIIPQLVFTDRAGVPTHIGISEKHPQTTTANETLNDREIVISAAVVEILSPEEEAAIVR